MESSENTNSNFDASYNTLICQDDEADHPANQDKLQVSVPIRASSRRHKPIAVSLGLLAVTLLAVDIGLAVHYKNLTDTHLTFEDVLLMKDKLTDLHDTYKTAIETMGEARKQVATEVDSQRQTNWELQHQMDRARDYENQIKETQKTIAALKSHIPMTRDGCTYCLPGWILMNSMCYYFSSDHDGRRQWRAASDDCKQRGGQLAIIDSKVKQNTTVTYLMNKKKVPTGFSDQGYYIGLRKTEGDWKWLDGTLLVEGFWMYFQSRYSSTTDCVAIYPNENFFKTWRDTRCEESKKWICQMAPTSTS